MKKIEPINIKEDGFHRGKWNTHIPDESVPWVNDTDGKLDILRRKYNEIIEVLNNGKS